MARPRDPLRRYHPERARPSVGAADGWRRAAAAWRDGATGSRRGGREHAVASGFVVEGHGCGHRSRGAGRYRPPDDAEVDHLSRDVGLHVVAGLVPRPGLGCRRGRARGSRSARRCGRSVLPGPARAGAGGPRAGTPGRRPCSSSCERSQVRSVSCSPRAAGGAQAVRCITADAGTSSGSAGASPTVEPGESRAACIASHLPGGEHDHHVVVDVVHVIHEQVAVRGRCRKSRRERGLPYSGPAWLGVSSISSVPPQPEPSSPQM